MKKTICLTIVVLLIAAGAATAGMQKGPYLIYPGDNTKMTALWQMDSTVAEGCKLEWGETLGYGSSVTVTESGSGAYEHQYEYTIGSSTPLEPGTKYYYRVREGVTSGVYHTGSFVTGPAVSATSLKFLAYGDTRSQPAVHDTVNQAMVATYQADPNYQTFTLHTGDFIANGDNELDWADQFFGRTRTNTMEMQANLPIQGCRGNHEGTGALLAKYWPYPFFPSGFYGSFDYGPVHVAVVDVHVSYGTGSAQLTWLENDLGMTTKKWKFIVLHAPGYSAGAHDDIGGVRSYIQPLCEAYGVDIVFAGHNHYYARCDANGVKHITTGGGGAPLYTPNPNYIKPGDDTCYVETCSRAYHFCKIDISGDELTLQAVQPDGTVIDEFTMTSNNTEADVTFFSISDSHYEATDAENTAKIAAVERMNALPGTAYPAGVGGGVVRIPRGVLALGDLIDDGAVDSLAPLQWAKWKADFGVNGEGRLKFPVFEGFGNHDLNWSHFVQDDIAARTLVRPWVSYVSPNGLHYSWDWERVHFVQLNLYPGNDPNSTPYSPIHDPEYALDFLIDDLITNVGGSGRPVILMHHFDLAPNWWYQWAIDQYYDVIKDYNIICIIHGHTGTGIYKWREIDVVNDGNLAASIFVFHIEGDRLTVVRRTNSDTWSISLQKTFIFPPPGGRPAWDPTPPDDPAGEQPIYDLSVTLQWRPGTVDVNSYDIYFGTNATDVNTADNSGPVGTPNDSIIYKGNQPVDSNEYGPIPVELGTTYYWRIDELNDLDAVTWKGILWSFTVGSWGVVENFESYTDNAALAACWNVSGVSGATATLETGITHDNSEQAMKVNYNNSSGPYYSEIVANISGPNSVGFSKDWTRCDIKALTLCFFGDPGNDATEQMYVALEDGGGHVATVSYGGDINEDMNDIKDTQWHEWNIALQDFNDGGISLTDVNRIYIGFGDRNTPHAGGNGLVYFDDIRLYPPRCVPEKVLGDLDSDCDVDYMDFMLMVDEWLYDPCFGPQIPGDAVAHYELEDGSASTVSDSADSHPGTIIRGAQWVAGAPGGTSPAGGLSFDGSPGQVDLGNWVPSAPDGSFSLAFWIKWDGGGVAVQHLVGKYAGWNMNDSMWLVEMANDGVWRLNLTSPNRIYFGTLPVGGWTHVTLTYDGPTKIAKGYHNGEFLKSGTYNMGAGTGAKLYFGGNNSTDRAFVGDMDDIRFYNRVLSEEEIIAIATAGGGPAKPIDFNRDGKINFKDFAILATMWLEGTGPEGPMLFP